MTQASKVALNTARDIPFNKLILSQNNVRRIKDGVSIDHLSDDIARRGLIQSLNVRPVIDADGAETGMFEVPAGGRRYRAVERLVKAKRLAKTAPVPCVVRAADAPTSAEEDSLAENVQRAPLHPLDQFRAFLTLREQGQSEEEIAAVFFVAASVVKQRLRLASVSPKLLDVYADDGMTLEQLMAFTVNGDHERQEQVFERLCQSYSKEPYVIRRMLTEGAVKVTDKRAQLVGLEAYIEAGGVILRDLFEGDQGGWMQDVGLLDMLVAEQLREQSDAIRAEGWKWIEVAPDFAYGHVYGQVEQDDAAEPRAPPHGQPVVLAFDVVDDHRPGPGEERGHYQPHPLAAAGRREAQDMLGTVVTDIGIAKPAEHRAVRPEQACGAHLLLGRPTRRAAPIATTTQTMPPAAAI